VIGRYYDTQNNPFNCCVDDDPSWSTLECTPSSTTS